jgi:hypothetical protein
MLMNRQNEKMIAQGDRRRELCIVTKFAGFRCENFCSGLRRTPSGKFMHLSYFYALFDDVAFIHFSPMI